MASLFGPQPKRPVGLGRLFLSNAVHTSIQRFPLEVPVDQDPSYVAARNQNNRMIIFDEFLLHARIEMRRGDEDSESRCLMREISRIISLTPTAFFQCLASAQMSSETQ